MCLRAASLPSTSAAFLIASISAFAAVRIFVGLVLGARCAAPSVPPLARPSRSPTHDAADQADDDRDEEIDRVHQLTS